jgi:hypothetical protein
VTEVHENQRRGTDGAGREERLTRVRDMIATDLARGRLRGKHVYVSVIEQEFGIARRTGYDDVDEVWDEIRQSEDRRVVAAQRRILARLDDYVGELWDLYQECRAEGDRGNARAVLADLAKARDLLAPEKLEVTIAPAFDTSKLTLDEKRDLLAGIRKARVDEPS